MKVNVYFSPSFVDIHIYDESKTLLHCLGLTYGQFKTTETFDWEGNPLKHLIINFSGSIVSYTLSDSLFHSFNSQVANYLAHIEEMPAQ